MSKSKIFIALLLTVIPFSGAQAINTKYTGNCSILAKETGKYPEKKVKGYPSESIYKKMTTANQLMSEGQKSQAIALVNEVKNSTQDAFTLSVVYQYLARDAYERNNFTQAVNYAKKVVDLDALPVNAILQMKKQVAYAYVSKKDYKSAIGWLKQYFNQVIKPPVSDYKTLAQLYYQDNDYRNAICPAYIALKKTTKKKDRESLYKMLFGLHYQLKDMAGSANILSEMINHFPNDKKYWEQLFSIEYQRGNEANALAVSELAYKKGLWTTEKEFKNLASLHANSGAPLVAARIFEDGFKKNIISRTEENLKLLARYYDNAKEDNKAVSAYKAVSKISNKGIYAYRIGNVYFGTEDYKNAITYFQTALNKGGLKEIERGNAYLQMGGAHFYLGNESAAISAFEKAKNISRVRTNATSWLSFVREKQRIREILRKEAEELEAEVAAEKAKAEERTN